ncbi:hypothetical protein [Arthrobacter pigmenti]
MTAPHTPRSSQPLTPYDTGERLEPHPWVSSPEATDTSREGDSGDYGRVDFDDDEAQTVLTAYVERGPDGYVLHLQNHQAVPVTVQDDTPEQHPACVS